MALLSSNVTKCFDRLLRLARAIRILATCLLLLSGLNTVAQSGPSKEYRVKAVLLFNFSQFIDWPPQTFSELTKPLQIGVLGENPFSDYLDEVVRGERVNGRLVAVKRYRAVEEIQTCHILFISRSEANQWKQIFTALTGRSILTVGDGEDFAQSGGMIQVVTVGGKTRLHINMDAVKAAGLTISSKLLRSAEIINPGSQ